MLALLLLTCNALTAQYKLNFHASDADLQELNNYNWKQTSPDSLQLTKQLDDLLLHLQSEGFLEARYQSTWTSPQQLEVVMVIGPKYQWVNLKPGLVAPALLQQVGYRDRFYRRTPFHYREVSQLLQRLVQRSADQGHPFATAKLDSVNVQANQVSAVLQHDPGPLITFDSLSIEGSLKIRKKFLQNYLRIRPGEPYAEALVKTLPAKLNRLPYASMQGTPRVSFQNDQATLYLELSPKKANQIDGVIGFLPNSKNDGELLLTGQFDLSLRNMFGGGRSFDLHWQSYKPQSQLLDLAFIQPLLFSSPINLGAGFHLLKEDSTFVNTQFDLDLSYLFDAYGSLTTYTRIKTTRLSANEALESITSLGDLADFDLTEYGIGYQWSKLDDLLNPHRGAKFDLSLSGGTKKIRRNSALEDSVYNDVDFRSSQWRWTFSLEKYWWAGKRWVIAAKIKGGGIYNDRLFFNDLFRLGGLKSIRGFSENTFFASEYVYTTLEPRFFIDSQSYLFVFYDQGWQLKYELEDQSFNDSPTGLGAGISLTTNAGNFNFAWAVGSSQSQDLGLPQSKIHFGYVTTF